MFNVTKKPYLPMCAATLGALFITGGNSYASDDADSLAKANQAMSNPITDYTMFITENDTTSSTGEITDQSRYTNVTLIEPVIPISVGDSGWNLINRPVIPLVASQVPEVDVTTGKLDWDTKSGLGDIVVFSLVKPPTTGNFQWGVGPTLIMPTATDDAIGAEKWSAGPAAIALYSSPEITYGALVQQWWSFDGKNDRDDVSKLNVQYFFTKQFTPNWSFITAPTIVADWKAKSGNVWSVPVSAGIAYSFKWGKIPVRVLAEPQIYLIKPDDFGSDWQLRLAFAMVLPKL